MPDGAILIPTPAATLGFLTAVEQSPHGLFGGYLLLNTAGQPLEFHCTTPVKATRIQQILYGPTLEPFLYGEQIGATLVKKSEMSPLLLVVDRSELLAVRQHIKVPTALVCAAESYESRGDETSSLTIGGNRLQLAKHDIERRHEIVEQLAVLDASFDLAEPFGRIRAAIEEALRTGAKAA
jgi:hypothetical protein